MLITFFQDGLLLLLRHLDLPASWCILFGMILYLSGTLHCSKKKYGWCLQRRCRQPVATEEEHEIVRNKNENRIFFWGVLWGCESNRQLSYSKVEGFDIVLEQAHIRCEYLGLKSLLLSWTSCFSFPARPARCSTLVWLLLDNAYNIFPGWVVVSSEACWSPCFLLCFVWHDSLPLWHVALQQKEVWLVLAASVSSSWGHGRGTWDSPE